MNTFMSEASRADIPWVDALSQLEAHVGSTAKHRCLLWVDPAQADPFAGNALVEQQRVTVPIRHPRFDLARAPYLIPLDLTRSSDNDLFRNSVEMAWLSWSTEYLDAMCGQPICGWVLTEASPTAVARHWGTHCHLHIFQRQHRLLRFQDPGVREWLWPTLRRTQQQLVLGHAVEVLAIGRTQQLIQHGSAGRSIQPPGPSQDELDSSSHLRLEQSQWDQIDDYATLHAAWLAWRQSATDKAAVVKEAGWEHAVLQALTHAGQLGIRDPMDRELFALHALQMGAHFYRNPKLDGIWLRTRAGEFYGSAVESVTGSPADRLSISV